MASALCRSSTSDKTSTLMIPGSPLLFPRSIYPQSKNKKAHITRLSGMWASELVIKLQLSPETPLARDGVGATRVAHARTTHQLAAASHQGKEYFPGLPEVKGTTLQS